MTLPSQISPTAAAISDEDESEEETIPLIPFIRPIKQFGLDVLRRKHNITVLVEC